jgi:thioesterase DpgC
MTDNVLEQAVKGWARTAPARTTELSSDKAGFGHFWQRSGELLARLPLKPRRNAGEAAAAAEILALARDSRTRFMRAHAREVYDALTAKRSMFVRVDELCGRAAKEYPGLVPDAKTLEHDSGIAQGNKDGLEVDQGIFLSQVLADAAAKRGVARAPGEFQGEPAARRRKDRTARQGLGGHDVQSPVPQCRG